MFTREMVTHLEAFTQEMLGVPWVENSFDPKVGLDCWSFVFLAYKTCGIDLHPNLWGSKPLFHPVAIPGAPGDVLHFWYWGAPREHLGIRLHGARFADCNWSGKGVAIHDLFPPPWSKSLKGAWRYVGEPSASTHEKKCGGDFRFPDARAITD